VSVTVDNLHKTYRQGAASIEALRGVNAKIEEGELVAILGASGSGKSTLLGLLAGLDQPTSGRVLVGDTDLYALTEAKRTDFRARHISLVFQQFHLLPHLTALENVGLPLEILGRPDPFKAAALLEAVGLGPRAHHLPSELSGGECQRVAIARALITEPRLLLADEPSGNLDSETAATVMELFFRTVREKRITCFLVTHNEELAKRCDRVLRIQGGKV
jgi:predicted ABC-type transport system involved in lysophospholipase L1 biosynthesis ATPase subunit